MSACTRVVAVLGRICGVAVYFVPADGDAVDGTGSGAQFARRAVEDFGPGLADEHRQSPIAPERRASLFGIMLRDGRPQHVRQRDAEAFGRRRQTSKEVFEHGRSSNSKGSNPHEIHYNVNGAFFGGWIGGSWASNVLFRQRM